MADVFINLPDGSVGRFPDTMSDVQIRGIIAHAFPKEVGAAAAAKPMERRDTAGHGAFDGSKVPGYDPATGIVTGGAIDDRTGQEYGTGIRQGIEGALGLAGDIAPMAGRGASKLAELLGMENDKAGKYGDLVSMGVSTVLNPVGAVLPYPNAVSTQDIQENITDPLLGKPDDPLTLKGDIARASGNFAGAAFAPGGVVRKGLSMALPVAGGEMAAALAPEGYEDYARFGGQLAGGALTVPKIGGKPIAEAAKDLGVKSKDMTRIIKRMQQDGMTPDQIRARLDELGPDATLMDVGPNLRQEGQRIHAAGGRGRGIIDETLTARDQGASGRIRSELDANLGPAPVPSKVDAGLRATQKRLGPEYEKALGNARAVDTEAIANDIQSAIANERGAARTALESVLDDLRIKGTDQLDPHPRAALATRHSIDGMISGTQDSNVRRVLTAFRKRLDAELTNSVPNIKDVDAKFERLAKQREAVERGQTVLDSGRTSPRPTELAAEIAKGGPAIRGRLSQGARAEIDRIVGTNANDRVALQRIIKGEGDWNRDKLGQLFGKDKADRMIAVLEREGTFADTSNRVMKNSATAERLPDANDAFGMLPSWKSGGMLGLARAAASELGEAFLDKMRSTAAEARDSGVAKVLAGSDHGRIVTALIKANGGKALPKDKIESAVRALLLGSSLNGSGQAATQGRQ